MSHGVKGEMSHGVVSEAYRTRPYFSANVSLFSVAGRDEATFGINTRSESLARRRQNAKNPPRFGPRRPKLLQDTSLTTGKSY